jgi:hypothetical protein
MSEVLLSSRGRQIRETDVIFLRELIAQKSRAALPARRPARRRREPGSPWRCRAHPRHVPATRRGLRGCVAAHRERPQEKLPQEQPANFRITSPRAPSRAPGMRVRVRWARAFVCAGRAGSCALGARVYSARSTRRRVPIRVRLNVRWRVQSSVRLRVGRRDHSFRVAPELGKIGPLAPESWPACRISHLEATDEAIGVYHSAAAAEFAVKSHSLRGVLYRVFLG